MPSRALLSASFINQSNSIPSGYTHSISPWRNYSFKPGNLDVFQRFIIHLNGKNDVIRTVLSSKSVCCHFLSNNLGNVNAIFHHRWDSLALGSSITRVRFAVYVVWPMPVKRGKRTWVDECASHSFSSWPYWTYERRKEIEQRVGWLGNRCGSTRMEVAVSCLRLSFYDWRCRFSMMT